MKQIQLAYRKIIDAQSTSVWERYVFEDSYKEFLMQFQFYNTENKYYTFSRLSAAIPAAEKLHFLVSTAVTGYITQLQNKIPGIQNTLGKIFLPFHLYCFEIIDSDIRDKKAHRVAIIFYSEPLQWLDTIGEHLLISIHTGKESTHNKEMIRTELVKLQPFMSIYSLQKTNHATAIPGQDILS
ncbi:MAG TPA: hypothetical protein PKE30_05925 [Niabella sp.]|nr:hypothetical protein [Niabella sp.]